jgi:hypothetical protein
MFWQRLLSAPTAPTPSPASVVVKVATGLSPVVNVAVSEPADVIVIVQVLSPHPAAAPVPLDRRPGCWPAGALAAIVIVDPNGIWNVQVVEDGVVQRPPPAPTTAAVPAVLPPTMTVSVAVCASARAGAPSHDSIGRTAATHGRARRSMGTSQTAIVNMDGRRLGIPGRYWSVTLTTARLLNVPVTVLCEKTTMPYTPFARPSAARSTAR